MAVFTETTLQISPALAASVSPSAPVLPGPASAWGALAGPQGPQSSAALPSLAMPGAAGPPLGQGALGAAASAPADASAPPSASGAPGDSPLAIQLFVQLLGNRIFLAISLIIITLVGGIICSFYPQLKELGSVLTHALTALLGGFVGILVGDQAAHREISKQLNEGAWKPTRIPATNRTAVKRPRK
jgi:hypothetical protein